MPVTSGKFFQAGGSLSAELPSYIERQADQDLYTHLRASDFCYVLTARQMGKSSLKVRTMERLRQEGWATASVDLTAFGTTGFTTAQWYESFLSEIADALDLDEIFDEWWDSRPGLTPVARMSAFWEEVVLKGTSQKIALMIDEVDTMLSLDKQNFSTDDFFAAIRAAYNRRSKNPDFERLNFAILGVAAPQDLMSDHERTPFNIGVPIRIQNFSQEEAVSLQEGFANEPSTNQALLERIMYWTAGQPYLSQELSQSLSITQCTLAEVNPLVDERVAQLFFQPDIYNSAHFGNIQTRILANDAYNLRMLGIYQEILRKGHYALSQRANEQLYLKLSGLVQEQSASLVANNRIYTRVFDEFWLEKAYGSIKRPFMPDLQRWLNTGRSADALLKGKVLQEAEAWANSREDLSRPESEFLLASRLAEVKAEQARRLQTEKDRQQKRLRVALGLAIVAFIIATIAGIYGFNQASQAKKRVLIAETQASSIKILNRPREELPTKLRLLERAWDLWKNQISTPPHPYSAKPWPRVFIVNSQDANIPILTLNPSIRQTFGGILTE
ncbi:MAG: AAA-like domain-containing protein [Bacteroidota bacterium]